MTRTITTTVLAAALTLGLASGAPRPATAAEKGMQQKVTAAKTAADHTALAAEYDELAKEAQAKAEEHRAMAAAYRKAGGAAAKAQLPEHCDGLVTVYEGAAKNYAEMARAHRELAQGSK